MQVQHGSECTKCSNGKMSLVSYSRGFKGNTEQGIKPQKPRLEYECERCEYKQVRDKHVGFFG